MARPRTPTAVLEAKGAFRKDPQRAVGRTYEPKPVGAVGKPPSYFDSAHKKAWKEVIAASPQGVLALSDRFHLELTVRLLCKMRNVPGRMSKHLNFLGKALLEMGMSPLDINEFKEDMRKSVGCSAQELALLATCLTRIGMTPADRSKVMVEPEKRESKLAALVGTLSASARPN